MRHVVYGAGAVGGVVGARLHRAGVPVTLVARGDHLRAINERGLLLDTADGVEAAVAPATDSAAGVRWTDDTVVLLAVKSHQTTAALEDLTAHAPPDTPVACLQNGVVNEVAVLRRFRSTYAVCVMLPALHLRPGRVVQKCTPVPGILDVGRFPGGTDAVTEGLSADFRAAGFHSEPRDDVMAWKHRKLLVNAAGDVSALFEPGPEADELAARVTAEGEAVLAAAGIPVVSAAADDERRGDLLRPRPDIADFRGNSLAQSRARGLPTEVDYRVGEVVLLGRLHGVATPAAEQVLAAARPR